jgi:hypothetical protein
MTCRDCRSTATRQTRVTLWRFDGSMSWTLFNHQLKPMVEYNSWKDQKKDTHLWAIVQGQAVDILHSIPTQVRDQEMSSNYSWATIGCSTRPSISPWSWKPPRQQLECQQDVCDSGWSTFRPMVTREQVQQDWMTSMLAVGALAILGETADKDATRRRSIRTWETSRGWHEYTISAVIPASSSHNQPDPQPIYLSQKHIRHGSYNTEWLCWWQPPAIY